MDQAVVFLGGMPTTKPVDPARMRGAALQQRRAVRTPDLHDPFNNQSDLKATMSAQIVPFPRTGQRKTFLASEIAELRRWAVSAARVGFFFATTLSASGEEEIILKTACGTEFVEVEKGRRGRQPLCFILPSSGVWVIRWSDGRGEQPFKTLLAALQTIHKARGAAA